MKLLLAALLAALLTAACSPAGTALPPGPLAFMPGSPEAWRLFDRASEKVEAVSGVRPYAAIDGVSINVGSRKGGDSPPCGETLVGHHGHKIESMIVMIYLDEPKCFDDPSDTLVHELIHVVRFYAGLDFEHVEHSEAGVFRDKTGDSRFEETSLNRLCEAIDCVIYNPEE